MELRTFAIHILSGETIEEKLFDPPALSDSAPGSPLFWKQPARCKNLQFVKHSRREGKLPALSELHHPEKTAVCMHRFCGHELLAVEMMAYALLAFPEAPRPLRMGIANTLKEEQEHVRLYCKRLNELGIVFGDLPLYKHFWRHTPYITSPIRYLSMMSLTFEMANLDFAPYYGEAFRKVGDQASEDLMNRILKDEISHVSFGMGWFNRLARRKEDASWNEYCESLYPYLTPKRAKGRHFKDAYRKKAGIPSQWIEQIERA